MVEGQVVGFRTDKGMSNGECPSTIACGDGPPPRPGEDQESFSITASGIS